MGTYELNSRLSLATMDTITYFKKRRHFTFRNISASFTTKGKKERLHEFELSQLSFASNKEKKDFKEDHFIISIRYEINYPFSENFNANHKLKFYFGFFFEPFYERYYFESNNTNVFSTIEFKSGLKVGPSFRSQYWFSDRFFTAIGFSIQSSYFGVAYETRENPIIPPKNQKKGGFEFDVMGEWISKLGIGITF